MASYRFKRKNLQVIPHFYGRFSIYEIDNLADKVFLNEGVHQGEFGSYLKYKWGTFYPYTYIGYRLQAEGRANLFLWSAGTYKRWKSITLGGAFWGFSPVSDDDFTNKDAERSIVNDRVNAGSLKFFAVNPSETSLLLWMDYNMSLSTKFGGGYQRSMDGKNMAVGDTFLAYISLDFGSFKNRKRQVTHDKEIQKLNEFKVESETYDPSLFDEDKK